MRESVPVVEARVEFLSPDEGGRRLPAHDSREYRPHVVAGDVGQRQAIVGENGRTLVEDSLPVAFSGNGRVMYPNRPYSVRLVLWCYPYSGYGALSPGATFTIREAQHIVGFGEVTRWHDGDAL